MNVNLKGTFFYCKYVVPHMIAQKKQGGSLAKAMGERYRMGRARVRAEAK